MTMWLPGREAYWPVWMVVCTSGGLYGQPSGQSDITTSDCVSALLRERHSLPARSETLSEAADLLLDHDQKSQGVNRPGLLGVP